MQEGGERLKHCFLLFLIVLVPGIVVYGETIVIDGDNSEWGTVATCTIHDAPDDSSGPQDIQKIQVHMDDTCLYVCFSLQGDLPDSFPFLYYVNIDTDYDDIRDYHLAHHHSQGTYILVFSEDGLRVTEELRAPSLQLSSVVSDSVEMCMDKALLEGVTDFQLWGGLYSTLARRNIDEFTGRYTSLELSYTFTTVDTSNHRCAVSIDVSGFPLASAVFRLPYLYGVPPRDEDLFTLHNVRAEAMGGKPLAIATEGAAYIIDTRGKPDFRISYEVTMDQINDFPVRGRQGYLCDAYLLTSSNWTFLIPIERSPRRVFVDIEVPGGWQVVAPWTGIESGLAGEGIAGEGEVLEEEKQTGVGSHLDNILLPERKAVDSTGTTRRRFREDDFVRFKSSTFGAGHFDVREVEYRGTLFTIAISTDFSRFYRNLLFDGFFSIGRYIKDLHDTGFPPRHLSIFPKAVGTDEWQSANEHGESHGEAIGDDPVRAAHQMAHRMFHTYNACYPWGMNVIPHWYLEGVNTYYDYRAVEKAGFAPPFSLLARSYFDTYLPGRDTFDAPLTGRIMDYEDWERTAYLAYEKGALVSYLLDREIRKQSEGGLSFDRFQTWLYWRYHSKRGVLDDGTLLSELNEFSGGDFSAFFKSYVVGTSFIDLSSDFSDDDLDGLVFVGEQLLETDPLQADTDGDGASDGYEYVHDGDPLDPNKTQPKSRQSRVRSIYTDGFDFEWGTVAHVDIIPETHLEQNGPQFRSFSVSSGAETVHLLLQFDRPAALIKNYRIFFNLDLDRDGHFDKHLGWTAGQGADTALFTEEYQTYGHERASFYKGFQSGTGEVVEISLPLAFFEGYAVIDIAGGSIDVEALCERIQRFNRFTIDVE